MYKDDDRPSMLVTGFIKEPKSEGANPYVMTGTIRTKDIEDLCGSEYVSVMISVSKSHPQERRLVKFIPSDPKYYKDPRQFMKGGQGGGGSNNNNSGGDNGNYVP